MCPRPAGMPAILLVCALARLPFAPVAAHAMSPAMPRPTAVLPPLHLRAQPAQLAVNRNTVLTIHVLDGSGKPVDRALVKITGSPYPEIGTTSHGLLTLSLRPVSLGALVVQASLAGYRPATLHVPVVPGSPATVVAIKRGVSVLAPHSKPQSGKVGSDLFEQYHAMTGKLQFASLGLRDGTLVDLNASTDVQIRDPLHMTLSKGELFLEVVHGSASHQVQVGSAVAATKGTRLDLKVDPKTHAAVITVVEGRVLVSNTKARGPTSSVLVGAGQQTTVTGSSPPTAPKRVDLSRLLAWVNNLPNTNATTVPPVLNLPLPRVTPVSLAPVAPAPAITVTGTLSSTTWAASGGPYLLTGGVTVPAGTVLTIAPGAMVEMGQGAYLYVQGTLRAQGTSASPITFTSALPQPRPGDWQDVQLDGAPASGSILDHVQMFYGSANAGAAGLLELTGGANVSVTNSVFAQGLHVGLWIDDNTRPTITHCVFGGDGDFAVDAPVDDLGLLTGIGYGQAQQGMHLRGGTISHSASWELPDVPFVLSGGVTVPAAVSLTLAPGIVMLMDQGAYFYVQGTLTAQGTSTAPIVFTSALPQPKPGDWQYLQLDGTTAGASILDHVEIFYASANAGASGSLLLTGGANATVSNSVFSQGLHLGIWVDDNTRPTITQCIFAGNGDHAVDGPVDDLGLFTGIGYGSGQQGMYLRGGTISHSASWDLPGVPFVLSGGIEVAATVTLTLPPGMAVLMDQGAYLDVQGTLKAQGTPTAPIVFTSALPQPQPGDWQYVRLDGTTAGASVLDYVQIFYASSNGGPWGSLTLTNGANVTVSNGVFAQGLHLGIWVDDNTRPTITACVLAGDGDYAIEAPVDDLGLFTDLSYGPGQLGIHLRGGALAHTATWEPQDVPIVLSGGTTLAATASVTVAPGTVVEMDQGAYLDVQGTLIAKGTAAAPIVFTSALPRPRPGDWQYLQFDGTPAGGSVLDHVQVLFAGANAGSSGAVSVLGDENPTITHCLVSGSAHDGIWVDVGHPTIAFCSFTGDAGAAISLPAKDPQHVHDNTLAPGQKGVEIRP